MDGLTRDIEIISVSQENQSSNFKIRDAKDIPVLRAAIMSKCEIIITGDKDFLEEELPNLKAIKAIEFYSNY